MATYYVGWDVGAWHCQDNRNSRDAIIACCKENTKKTKIFYGNAALYFSANNIDEFFKKILNIEENENNYIVAVDAVLGWPVLFRKLISGIPLTSEEIKSIEKVAYNEKKENPLLMREAERNFPEALGTPLSAVNDMIGSQSTKILFFLQKFGFTQKDFIWSKGENKFFEVYPTAIKNCIKAAEFVSKVDKKDISAFYPQIRRCNKLNWKQDIEDAYYALWAALNKGEMEEVFNPTCECEGSIWLPKQK